jgi:hypothetical protein
MELLFVIGLGLAQTPKVDADFTLYTEITAVQSSTHTKPSSSPAAAVPQTQQEPDYNVPGRAQELLEPVPPIRIVGQTPIDRKP